MLSVGNGLTELAGLPKLKGGLHFGAALRMKLGITPVASAMPAQLGAVLGAQIAARLAAALPSEIRGAARDKLAHHIASALAPPRGSPPGTGTAEQVSALAQRLGDLLSVLARETERPDAGQQKRISGKVLDANAARELPAQPTKIPATDSARLAPPVEALLRGAMPAPKPQTQAAEAGVLHSLPVPPETPDILARMLGRAAQAGVKTAAQAPAPLPGRLSSVIAEGTAARGDAHGGGGGGRTPSFVFGGTPGTNGFAGARVAGAAGDTSNFAAQLAALPAHPASAPAAGPLPPGPAPAHVPVDPQLVIEQMVVGIRLHSDGATSRLRLRLQPEHLGDVSLSLTVTGGTIGASITAQSADVRDMLLAHQHQLARALADAGLSLGHFSVDVSGGNTHGSGQQQFGEPGSRHGHFADVPRPPGQPGGGEWIEPRWAPPEPPRGGIGLLNHLA